MPGGKPDFDVSRQIPTLAKPLNRQLGLMHACMQVRGKEGESEML